MHGCITSALNKEIGIIDKTLDGNCVTKIKNVTLDTNPDTKQEHYGLDQMILEKSVE